jgi:hypothetical protein
MPPEAPVLGRDHRVDEVRRHAVRGDHAAELVATPGEGLPVAVQERDRAARAAVHEVGEGGREET